MIAGLDIFAPAAIEAALAGLRASGTATDWLLSFGIGTLIYGKKSTRNISDMV
jgi:hypothetical protein